MGNKRCKGGSIENRFVRSFLLDILFQTASEVRLLQ